LFANCPVAFQSKARPLPTKELVFLLHTINDFRAIKPWRIDRGGVRQANYFEGIIFFELLQNHFSTVLKILT
jgi:hypothetical protein